LAHEIFPFPLFVRRKNQLRALAPFINLREISRFVVDGSANMGGSISRIMSKLFANREMRILMLGLDAAGKTSTLHHLPSARVSLSFCPFLAHVQVKVCWVANGVFV